MRIFHTVCGSLVVVWLLTSCDAPRDNPLDPEANNYIGPYGQEGSVSGTVTNLASIPQSGALVLTVPGYRGAVTDDTGYYVIEDMVPDDYLVYCAPDGFEPDTTAVTINPRSSVAINFRLDALPIVQSFQVTSQYISQLYPPIPPDYYTIYAQSVVTDPDGVGDIEQVFLHIEDYVDTLMSFDPDSSTGSSFFYDLSLPEEAFPYGTVDSIKWKHFHCIVEDTSGNFASSDTLSIIRFFDDYPSTIYPKYYENVSEAQVELQWESFDALFFFTYDVRVYREINPNPAVYSLFWQRSGISSADTSVIVDDPFDNDTYYWELWVFDEYQNSARSAKSFFVYQGQISP